MMSESTRGGVLALVVAVALSGGIVKCAACTSHSSRLDTVRSALEVGGVAMGSSYKLAVKTCLELERVEIDTERRGLQTPSQTDADIARIREDCDRIRLGFEALRDLHNQAAAAYERGDLDDALARVEQIKREWRGLEEDAGDAGVVVIDGGAL